VTGADALTRVNTRLLALFRAGLLRRFFIGSGGGRRALYAISLKGAQLIHSPNRGPRRRSDEMLVADFFVLYQLALNALYCAVKFGRTPIPHVQSVQWLSFYAPVGQGLQLIPDGYAEWKTPSGIDASFIEVDHAACRARSRNCHPRPDFSTGARRPADPHSDHRGRAKRCWGQNSSPGCSDRAPGLRQRPEAVPGGREEAIWRLDCLPRSAPNTDRHSGYLGCRPSGIRNGPRECRSPPHHPERFSRGRSLIPLCLVAAARERRARQSASHSFSMPKKRSLLQLEELFERR